MAKKKTPQKKILNLKNAQLPVLNLKDYGVCANKDSCGKDCNYTWKKDKRKCPDYDSIQPYLPTLIPHYSLDFEVAETVAFGIINDENVLIVGPPGCGKTTLVKVLCAVSQREIIDFSAHEEGTYAQLIGQWNLIGEEMVWGDGYVTDALRNGRVLLENESDFMRPELRGTLHGVLDKGGDITIPQINPQTNKVELVVIPRHENFRWISTANTTGLGDDQFKWHGTQLQNAAARDRYSVIVKMDYLKTEKEVPVLVKRTGIDEDTAEKMSEVAWGIRNLVREGAEDLTYDFTMRRLLAWADYHQRKENKQEALRLAILNFAKEDPVEINSILVIVRSKFGESFIEGMMR